MLDEAFEGIGLSGEQRAGQFGFTQLVHAPIVAPWDRGGNGTPANRYSWYTYRESSCGIYIELTCRAPDCC
jgi:hypothetical protein